LNPENSLMKKMSPEFFSLIRLLINTGTVSSEDFILMLFRSELFAIIPKKALKEPLSSII